MRSFGMMADGLDRSYRLSDWVALQQHVARLLLLVNCIATGMLGVFGFLGAHVLERHYEQFLFISPQVSSLALLCGLLLGVAQLRLQYGRIVAVLVLLVLLSGLVIGNGLTVFGQRWLGVEVITIGACMLGALCAWLAAKTGKGPHPWPDRYGVFIAVCGCFFSVAGTYWFIDLESQQIERQVQNRAAGIAQDLQDALLQSVWSFQRMSERWSSTERAPVRPYVDMEFLTFLRDMPQAALVATIGRDLKPTQARLSNGVTHDDLDSLLSHPESVAFLRDVSTTDVAQLTYVPWEVQSKNVSFVASSWESFGGDSGLIVAAIDLQSLFEHVFKMRQLSGCLSVTSKDVTVYRTGLDSPVVSFYSAQAPFSVGGQTFEVTFWLERDDPDGFWDQFAWLFLLLGLTFTFFLNNSQRLAFIANRRARQIQHRAMHDPVTELPNRQMFEQFVKQCRQKASSDDSQLWVMFIALEGVRLINDSMGHGVGDRLLRTVGMRLKQTLGHQGLIARIDSGNFAASFVGLSVEQVDTLAAEFVRVISEPLIINPHLLRINSVLGIASSTTRSADAETLLSQADLAMLRARRHGHNTWHYFTQELGEQASQQLALHADLQVAQISQQLALHFQPVIDGESGAIVGFEALMRWHHPRLGLVSPSDFIPMAEETGQIVELTQWALDEAVRAAKKINKSTPHPIAVAVNISIVFFQRADFLQRIKSVLQRYDLPASLLEIEITESLMLDDLTIVMSKLRELDKWGVRIALDDFGTGYSGLNYLKQLPIHKVKLDRSFVSDIVDNPADAAIARAVVAVASLLQLTVTVEGVETETQFAFLKQIRCDQFQGYLFARPLALDGVMALLTHSKGILRLPDEAPSELFNQPGLLVVGDDSPQVQALLFHLDSLNVRVYRASDVAQASATLAIHEVQFLIASDQLAETAVIDLFARLKFLYPQVKRVLIASAETRWIWADALRDGMIEQLISSPILAHEVQALVREQMAQP